MDKQAGKQTNKQAGWNDGLLTVGWADRQTGTHLQKMNNGPVVRQAIRQAGKQTHRQVGRLEVGQACGHLNELLDRQAGRQEGRTL